MNGCNKSFPGEGKLSKQVVLYVIINGILFKELHGLFGKCYSFAAEHFYELPNHARDGVADLWYKACFVLNFTNGLA